MPTNRIENHNFTGRKNNFSEGFKSKSLITNNRKFVVKVLYKYFRRSTYYLIPLPKSLKMRRNQV